MHENIVQFYKGILSIIKFFLKKLPSVEYRIGTVISPLNADFSANEMDLIRKEQSFLRHIT